MTDPNLLPESFKKNMQELLGHEYEDFLASYQQPTRRGLRFNLLKTQAFDELVLDLGIDQAPIPWCAQGYQYRSTIRPAKSPHYNAGMFYIQEPSAMSPAAILRPTSGQRVLDLCAAPGGKSVQLAGYMQREGLLVSNDASPSRSRALTKNLEMAGVTNAIVLTEMPHRLAAKFEAFFDAILVDAPCSGEGMFRRDEDAVKAYTSNKPEACAAIQQEILHHAASMLKPGGRMVYSTCTFNTLENEGTIAAFLASHPDFELLPIDHAGLGLSAGFGIDNNAELTKTARIWPHKAPGEGHFIALMAKMGEATEAKNSRDKKTKGARPPEEFLDFCRECLTSDITTGGVLYRMGTDKSAPNRLYLQPLAIDLSGLRVARSGLLLGECVKGRFVPSQALAMGLERSQVRYSVDIDGHDAMRYLKGESMEVPTSFPVSKGKPWVLVCYKGQPLGWARLVQGRLKNHLPTSWVT